MQDAKTLLVGTTEAIRGLESRQNAKLLVVSDSHGAGDILCLILEVMGKDCDAMVFCGDGIQDVALALERMQKSRSFAQSIPPVVAFVEGNNDCDRYPVHNPLHRTDPEQPVYINLNVPAELTFKVCGHTVLMTHGHRYPLYNGLQSLVYRSQEEGADLLFYGHTHIASAQYGGNTLLLNPGSCSRPRGGQPATFATVEITKGSLFFDPTFYCFSGGKIKNYLPS